MPEPEIYLDEIKAANERAINRIRAAIAAFLNVEQIERNLQREDSTEGSAYVAKSSSLAPPCDALGGTASSVHPDK